MNSQVSKKTALISITTAISIFLLVLSAYVYQQSESKKPIQYEQPSATFVHNGSNQESVFKDPCVTAPIPIQQLSFVVPPEGWRLFIDSNVGFQFFYPSTLEIESATGVSSSIKDGDPENTCVHSTRVTFKGEGWTGYLSATRGGYGTGRESFVTSTESPFTTKKGTESSVMIDENCGLEEDEFGFGPDCGHWAAFEENGVSFLLQTFPDAAGNFDFMTVPPFAYLLSTIETVPF